MINLSIVWFVSLWNCFIGGLLKVLARKVLECCKQRPMSYSGRSLEAKRNEKVEAQLMEFQSETDH